jgi:hypothetical protein
MPEFAANTPPQKRRRLEHSSDQVGTDEEEHPHHPLYQVDVTKNQHAYKFANFTYFSNYSPAFAPSKSGAVEELTTWCPPYGEAFRVIPKDHIVPRRARNQAARAKAHLYPKYGSPEYGSPQGDHTDDDSDEYVERVDNGKGRGAREGKGKERAMEKAEEDAEEEAEEGKEGKDEEVQHQHLRKIKGKGKAKEADTADDDVVIDNATINNATINNAAIDNAAINNAAINNAVVNNSEVINVEKHFKAKDPKNGGRPSKSFEAYCEWAAKQFRKIMTDGTTMFGCNMKLMQKEVGWAPQHGEHRAASVWTAFQKVYAHKEPKKEGQSVGMYKFFFVKRELC